MTDLTEDLAENLNKRIIGQPSVGEQIAPYLTIHGAGLSPPERPVGVFLLLGPTGVGKTETVKALATELHGDASCMMRIDCAEFNMEHEVAKIIGAPPGYTGHRDTSVKERGTEARITQMKLVECSPEHYRPSIVLFDEIEKGADSLTKLLLGIMDNGILHLGDGGRVKFDDCLIFMTSNLGSRAIQGQDNPAPGFLPATKLTQKGIKRATMTAARKYFTPEFMNRIDEFITYRPLSQKAIRSILDLQILEMKRRIQQGGNKYLKNLRVPDSVRNALVEKGASSQYGARELKRVLQRELLAPIAKRMADPTFVNGSELTARLSQGVIQLRIKRPTKKAKRVSRQGV